MQFRFYFSKNLPDPDFFVRSWFSNITKPQPGLFTHKVKTSDMLYSGLYFGIKFGRSSMAAVDFWRDFHQAAWHRQSRCEMWPLVWLCVFGATRNHIIYICICTMHMCACVCVCVCVFSWAVIGLWTLCDWNRVIGSTMLPENMKIATLSYAIV